MAKGPLVDTTGFVVGLNTSGMACGASLAIPASLTDLASLPAETDVLVLVPETASRSEIKRVLQTTQSTAILLLVDEETNVTRVLSGLRSRFWEALSLDATAEELHVAVRALYEGLLVSTPALMEPLLVHFPSTEEGESESLNEHLAESLTGREIEVLQLLAQGLANKQIAVSLGISEHTVKFHVSAVYAKLGAASRTEAVRLGVRRGLVIL